MCKFKTVSAAGPFALTLCVLAGNAMAGAFESVAHANAIRDAIVTDDFATSNNSANARVGSEAVGHAAVVDPFCLFDGGGTCAAVMMMPFAIGAGCTDGGGAGEQVVARPIVGSETVADAIAAIGGLPPVASKRDIWIARRSPTPGCPEQILPVDWVGTTQHGIAATNYQVMPGDRIYVKAQKLVTIDTALARALSPIERLLGVTLLGSSTVNQIQGRGPGFGN